MGVSNCLGGKPGDVAETVLLPGDPLRAKYIAENYLTGVKCYSEIRGMYGYTGEYRGKRVSVQATGMGVPSACIYLYDLIHDHGAKNFIRVGTTGSMNEEVKLRDLVLASSATTSSNVAACEFPGMTFAPTADFGLLRRAAERAEAKKLRYFVGPVFTSDLFYGTEPSVTKKLEDLGVLAVEMETAGVYSYAAKFSVRALSILTVSDSLVSGEEAPLEERRTAFDDMIGLALDIAE
jgi:purine-nucleoside phosphorylase